jgi:hypothetical protein
MGNFMAANLELAVSAIRSGRKEEGRQLLNLLIQQDPNDDKAWLWMSSVVETDEQRARCLYHVLAINPNSEIAQQGLGILGIVVSDSRPVRIPRDSQPIQIPRPTSPQPQAGPDQERRPFLVDTQAIAVELPFTPVGAVGVEPIQASPSILAIDVEADADEAQAAPTLPDQASQPSNPVPAVGHAGVQESPWTPVPDQVEQPASPSEPVVVKTANQAGNTVTQPLPEQPGLVVQEPGPTSAAISNETVGVDTRPLPGQSIPVQQPSEPGQFIASTETQRLPQHPLVPAYRADSPSEPVPVVQSNVGQPVQPQSGQNQVAYGVQNQPVDQSGQVIVPPGASPAAYGAPSNMPIPNETRPSQPVPVQGAYQNALQNQYPHHAAPPAYPHHANVTMGMPMQQTLPPQSPSQAVQPPHAAATMGMPIYDPNGQTQHPSEPIPVVQTSNTFGMVPMGQVQTMPPHTGIHSSATMMMPTMSEAEARARMLTGTAIPTASATAMALQNASNQAMMPANPAFHGYPSANGVDAETEQDDNEINIMAVIIFGTLSITALGGLGMLILLIFTAPVS